MLEYPTMTSCQLLAPAGTLDRVRMMLIHARIESLANPTTPPVLRILAAMTSISRFRSAVDIIDSRADSVTLSHRPPPFQVWRGITALSAG
jgi:hypothetical protein